MLHHTEKGTGPAIVFIHGYPLNHTIWQSQESLADRFRVLFPDLPGFGRSTAANLTMDGYADSVVNLLDSLKIEKATIFGHSMGGYILLSLADRFPERLDAMGLICSQAGGDSAEARDNRLKTSERVEHEGPSLVVDAMVEKLTSPVHDHLKAGLRSIMETATKEGVVTALRAMASRTDRFHVFSQLKIPVLILSGKQDALIPEDKARLMAERLKMGKWISLDDCGHMPMMEQPDQFNAEIRTFLTLVS